MRPIRHPVDKSVKLEFEAKEGRSDKTIRFTALAVNATPSVSGGGLVLLSVSENESTSPPFVYTLPAGKGLLIGHSFDLAHFKHFAILNVQQPGSKGTPPGTIF